MVLLCLQKSWLSSFICFTGAKVPASPYAFRLLALWEMLSVSLRKMLGRDGTVSQLGSAQYIL
jgi:hypothetical protein